ncbi:hypothetical protein ACFSQE_07265 [Vogesella fluminis]|uniref:Uncharacterized protein n=1 Tax=Vogesella fluminis TaxID=1069161 RepID=A0ABQ3H8S2_9NEIS|nr:hypothetical protein [Vogesella fluminis]GHD72200.1 hypothetical protein GCM10011419_05100 [Vogesella fluminis]
MATVFQQYLDAVQTSQQRMLAAQADCWHSWCRLSLPVADEQELIGQLDAPMMSGASVMQASADAQHELLLVLERWFGDQQRVWLQQSPALSATPCTMHLDLGFAGYLIASRASRQIQHFASTRFSYATLSAMRGARHAYRKCHNNPVASSVFYLHPTI